MPEIGCGSRRINCQFPSVNPTNCDLTYAMPARQSKRQRMSHMGGGMGNPMMNMMNPMSPFMMNPMNALMGGGGLMGQNMMGNNMMGNNMMAAGASSSEEEEPPAASVPAAMPPHAPASSTTQTQSGMVENEYLPEDVEKISRSTTTVRVLPRVRLASLVTHIYPEFDSGYTSDLSQAGILQLLWLLTRIKPAVKMSELRGLDSELM